MSLKAFHLFTVAAAILAASAYGMWCALSVLREGTGALPALASFGVGAALVIHGIRFYKQTEKEPWL
jgi:hypothetical protein